MRLSIFTLIYKNGTRYTGKSITSFSLPKSLVYKALYKRKRKIPKSFFKKCRKIPKSLP